MTEMTVAQRRAEFATPAPEAPAAPAVDDRAPYILVARYKKARAIAKHLLSLGATTDTTIDLGKTELGRTLASQAAGTHIPSEVTWALVVELVREVRP